MPPPPPPGKARLRGILTVEGKQNSLFSVGLVILKCFVIPAQLENRTNYVAIAKEKVLDDAPGHSFAAVSSRST